MFARALTRQKNLPCEPSRYDGGDWFAPRFRVGNLL